MRSSVSIRIDEASQTGEARRYALALAAEAGLGETHRGRVAIVVNELATNLLKHAGRGELLLRLLDGGIEVLALDRGPGMRDVAGCLRDGYSTTGTAGTGLGAVARQADVFDAYTASPGGSVLLAQILREAPRDEERITVGAVEVALAGERVCGDAWATDGDDHTYRVLVADGLGHGPHAAEAAEAAILAFGAEPEPSPTRLIERVHRALRSTRGAAVAAAVIDPGSRSVHYAGVGNIAGTVLTALGRRGLVSMSGIAGHEMRRVHEYAYPWEPEATLVLHSDGLGSRWSLDPISHPGLRQRHPSLIAGVLYRDFRRERDDVTIVVVKRWAPMGRSAHG